ncbi:MAG: hypothetical protein QM597_07170 [Aeromicrobium sp.]|uniref:DUF7373 family lipoprotein n=1 Tax=Aeromicrobium sp. TaxID=1871063 RepID=UPI0039E489DB
MSRRAAVTLALAATLVVSLAGCGGKDDPQPDVTPAETTTFDPDALDLGRIDPTGTDVDTALTPENARRAAAMELGEYLVLPQQLDEEMTGYGIETMAMSEPEDFDHTFTSSGDAFASAQVGLLTRRVRGNADAWITTAIVQFPDSAAAQAAVQTTADVMVAPDETGAAKYVTESVPGDDEAVGLAAVSNDVANQVYVLRAYGPFLVFGWFYDIDGDMDDVRNERDDFLLEQSLLLDGVDPVEISEEPTKRDLDPTGLWSKVLAADGRGTLVDDAAIYGGHTAQIFQIDASGLERAFDKAGISRVATNVTTVYVAENARGATSLVDDFVDQALDVGLEKTDSPAGLGDAICIEKPDEDDPDLFFWPSFMCYAIWDSYALESSGVSLEEAQQRISAQALLMYEETSGQKRSS